MHELITNALGEELASGFHSYQIVTGEMKEGYQPRDFFIATSRDGDLGYAHTFRPETENRHLSFSRLREAINFVPQAQPKNVYATFLTVLHSPQEIVASLVVSKNADGSTFVLIGHHKEISSEEGYSIIHDGMNNLTERYLSLP